MKLPLPIIFLVSSIILIKILAVSFPIINIIPPDLKPVSVIFFICGIYLITTISLLFYKKKTDIMPRGKPSRFIKTGAFKITRNPIYLGMILIILAVVIYYGSLAGFIISCVFIFLINKLVIPYEEKEMLKRFGKEYENYRNKVRKWL